MKKFLSIILALTFCLAAFSALAPSISAADAEFTQKDAKALIDAAVASRELLSNHYYENHMVYVQGAPFELGYKIDWKELYVPIEGQKFDELYVTLMEQFLPGGSYEGFLEKSRSIFTQSVAERFCTEYYYDNNIDLFIVKDGERFINSHAIQLHLGFYYVPENGKVELTEVTENRAKALVYCQKVFEPENIDIVVECIFEKTADGWRIGDSEFADMIVSCRNFDYFPEDINSYGHVVVGISNQKSIELYKYSAEDFADIGCVYVRDLCPGEAKWVQIAKDIEAGKDSLDNYPESEHEYIKSTLSEYNQLFCLYVKETDEADILEMCELLMTRSDIKFAEPDYNGFPVPTGDNAFDKIALCLGGMAVAVSLFCIVRRRREQ